MRFDSVTDIDIHGFLDDYSNSANEIINNVQDISGDPHILNGLRWFTLRFNAFFTRLNSDLLRPIKYLIYFGILISIFLLAVTSYPWGAVKNKNNSSKKGGRRG